MADCRETGTKSVTSRLGISWNATSPVKYPIFMQIQKNYFAFGQRDYLNERSIKIAGKLTEGDKYDCENKNISLISCNVERRLSSRLQKNFSFQALRMIILYLRIAPLMVKVAPLKNKKHQKKIQRDDVHANCSFCDESHKKFECCQYFATKTRMKHLNIFNFKLSGFAELDSAFSLCV